jgi:hypothetical protein
LIFGDRDLADFGGPLTAPTRKAQPTRNRQFGQWNYQITQSPIPVTKQHFINSIACSPRRQITDAGGQPLS